MPEHATRAGSVPGGFLEGLTGGFFTGSDFRRQRRFDAEDREDRRRRRIAEEIAANRRVVVEGQVDARSEREAGRFAIELHNAGLAPGDAPTAGVTPVGLPPGLIENVDSLRSSTGASLLRGFDPSDAPSGLHRTGPSPEQREQTEADETARLVGLYIQNPGAFDLNDLMNVKALMSENLLDDEVRRRTAVAAPPVSSPLQLLPGPEGLMSTFDPRGEPGERVAPLLGPSGEQFRGRVPSDNFARTNARAAVQAIARLDRFNFFGDDEQFAQEPDRIASLYGFDDAAHAQSVLSGAMGGDTDTSDTGGAVDAKARATELREQGLSDDEIIAQLRSEGLIGG